MEVVKEHVKGYSGGSSNGGGGRVALVPVVAVAMRL